MAMEFWINIHGYQTHPRNSHLCTENSYSTIAFVRHCKGPKHFGTECIRSNVYHTSPCRWKKDLWHQSIFFGSSFNRGGRIFHRNKKVGQCIYTVDHINFCFKSIVFYKLFLKYILNLVLHKKAEKTFSLIGSFK